MATKQSKEPEVLGFRMNYEYLEAGKWQRVSDFWVLNDMPIVKLLPNHVRVRDVKVKKEYRVH